jgi:hypothetical protein
VVERVTKVEMTFLQQWRVRVRRSGEGDRRRWCGFNTSVLAQEGRRQDKALPEDEVEAVSSSWLHGKELGPMFLSRSTDRD